MAGDEQTNTENDPGVEQANTGNNDAAAQNVQTNSTSQQQQAEASHEHRNQWILFGILVGILLGVVLAIAVLRPLIFNRIIPAVMGDFVTPETAVSDEAYPPAQEAAPTGENEVFIPAASGGETGETVPAEEPVVEEVAPAAETAPVAATAVPVTHTVQTGDNLTKIAAQYGVSVPEIMTANNLTNADYISVGQVLIIPAN